MIGEQAICIPNIGPRERRKRLVSGLIMLALSLIILIALVAAGVDRWWRLLLFLPLWGGATGLFQARERT